MTVMRPAVGLLLIAVAACTTSQATPSTKVTTVAIAENAGGTVGLQRDPRIVDMLREVNPARIRHIDSMLVSFGTRNTYSDTVSDTRGIGAARRWIHSQFSQFSADCGGCLRVEFDTGTIDHPRMPGRPQRLVTNVAAWRPGRDTTRVIVIAPPARARSRACPALP